MKKRVIRGFKTNKNKIKTISGISTSINSWGQYLYWLKVKYGKSKGAPKNYNTKIKGVEYHKYRNWFVECSRRGDKVCKSGFYEGQGWGALNSAWRAYKIAKDLGEVDKMYLYASAIQRIQKELNIAVSDFPHLDMWSFGDEFENAEHIPGERIGDENEDNESVELDMKGDPILNEELDNDISDENNEESYSR